MATTTHPAQLVLRAPSPSVGIGEDPVWYRHATIYQLQVRSFYDAGGDGVGDFAGLLQKLDYLQELGVTALWLLPFYPSPSKDDGYDITDFKAVHPQYGTLREFKAFLREAHHRGLRMIAELVLNHTSDQHPWFQRARRAPAGSRWRNFYVWSSEPDKYAEARVIFDEVEGSNWTWDPVARAYYWHRFYHHEPDLNYDNPEVQRAMLQVVDHWLGLGVDGLALNTVPYLFEREGTTCENLPETHQFLKAVREHVDANYRGRALVAVANQWPEDAAGYFGHGDECQAALHFPLMPRLYMALQTENRRPLVDIVEQTPPGPDDAQWLLFLRNQDELTLQMVTEVERDTMYRFFARNPQLRVHTGIRRRLAPLVENNRAKLELLNGLLFSLPGTPMIYYGDEIGMGDNVYLGDRASVRTPMQWSPDRNAGFSATNPQQLVLPVVTDPPYHYETVNVQTESQHPTSLLRWMKHLIAVRRQSRALTEGTFELLASDNPKILAFLRKAGDETVLVVANLSRFAQVAELDLPDFRGQTPVELFGGVPFPLIDEHSYRLTLPPHAFFWLATNPASAAADQPEPQVGHALAAAPPLAVIELDDDWPRVFEEPYRPLVERLLPGFLASRRWFGGKAKTIRRARIIDVIPLAREARPAEVFFVLVDVDYVEAEPETYLMPLGTSLEEHLLQCDGMPSEAVLARLRFNRAEYPEDLLLYDLFGEESFSHTLLDLIASRKTLQGQAGRLKASPTRAFARLRGQESEALHPKALKAESSNSVILYGRRLLMKLVRRIDEGVNPELEIGRFLTETVSFANIPPVAGAIEYDVGQEEPMTVGILSGFVPNEGNAWEFTLNSLDAFFERVVNDVGVAPPPEEEPAEEPLLELARREYSQAVRDSLGTYLQSAELLGRRTAEMHLALATDSGNPRFVPEPFTQLYQRSLYQGLRNQLGQALQLLENRLDALPGQSRQDADLVLAARQEFLERFRPLVERSITATRIRCHGDYHLGQVLYTGNDFVIIDFEGEPARTIRERRLKASPLRDVSGMLRSFDYAGHAARSERFRGVVMAEQDRLLLDHWVQFWATWTSAAYLRSYLAVAAGASFLPRDPRNLEVLLDAYLCEKALYELQYELNNRPDWAHIPLKGLGRLLE